MRRRFIQIDGELVEVTPNYVPDPAAPRVMPDIEPYQSMIDGSIITSRSRHREHLRAHGYEEVGNDSSLTKPPAPIPDVNPGGRKELIRRQIDSMTHAEFRRVLQRDLDNIRWNSRKN